MTGEISSCTNPPLLGIDKFEAIAKLLADKSIRYVTGIGNTGDKLIHAGAACLFRKMNTRMVSSVERPDFLVWGGGGNLGTLWNGSYQRRKIEFKKAEKEGIPIVIMPQSATNADEAFHESVIIFARERETQKIYPQSILAPDTSLAFDEDVTKYKIRSPSFELGFFLREDKDSSGLANLKLSIGDVTKLSTEYEDYFQIASWFETIITDRLHFAIASLILGRRTVLLPNNYFKNHAVYEASLRDLGCLWGIDEMEKILGKCQYDPEPIRKCRENFCNSKKY